MAIKKNICSILFLSNITYKWHIHAYLALHNSSNFGIRLDIVNLCSCSAFRNDFHVVFAHSNCQKPSFTKTWCHQKESSTISYWNWEQPQAGSLWNMWQIQNISVFPSKIKKKIYPMMNMLWHLGVHWHKDWELCGYIMLISNTGGIVVKAMFWWCKGNESFNHIVNYLPNMADFLTLTVIIIYVLG